MSLGACNLQACQSSDYLRCLTCAVLVPMSELTDLRPGECPGRRQADEPAFAYAGAFNELYDLCDDRGWELLLSLGNERPDIRHDGESIADLVIEVHGDGAGLPAAVHVPHEGDLDRYAAGIRRGLLHLHG